MLRNYENYTYPSKEAYALSSSGTAEGGFLFQSRTADQHRASKGAIRQSTLEMGWPPAFIFETSVNFDQLVMCDHKRLRLLIIIAEAHFRCSKAVSKHCPFSAMAETKTLIFMSSNGNVEGVKKALQRGGDPSKIFGTQTALHAAASGGHEEIVAVLLEHPGVDPNCYDKLGWSALHIAVHLGHYRVGALLLQQPGIEVNIPFFIFIAAHSGPQEHSYVKE